MTLEMDRATVADGQREHGDALSAAGEGVIDCQLPGLTPRAESYSLGSHTDATTICRVFVLIRPNRFGK